MHPGVVTSNDGVALAYRYRAPADAAACTIVLIHGWSGSGRYFDTCVPHLIGSGSGPAGSTGLLIPDLRFHGDSGRPGHGFHVARLAADLWGLLETLQVTNAVLVGTSLGAAVIWSFHELYGLRACGRVAGACFVDQAPLQNRVEGWEVGSKGIYDAESLARLTAAMRADMAAFADGNAACCLSRPLPAEVGERLKSETLRCDAEQLGRLMYDHTALDWRPTLPTIDVPCLSMYGSDSGCFPLDGLQAVEKLVPGCQGVCFQGCNHWLYLEEPERFCSTLLEFVNRI